MKSLIVLAGLTLLSTTAFSQTCTHVEMVSTVGPRAVLATFVNTQNDDCYEARKQCRLQSSGRGGVDCVRAFGQVAAPGPVPAPIGGGMGLDFPLVGDVVVVEGHQNNSVVERRTLQGAFEVRNQNTGSRFVINFDDLGVTKGCVLHPVAPVCVGDQVIARTHNNNSVLEALFRNGKAGYRNTNTSNRFFDRVENLAVTKGCLPLPRRNRVCIGDSVRGPGHTNLSTVEGFFANQEVVIRNSNTGNRFTFPVNSLQ